MYTNNNIIINRREKVHLLLFKLRIKSLIRALESFIKAMSFYLALITFIVNLKLSLNYNIRALNLFL